MPALFWIQTGACGGDSLALLSAESPSLEQLLSHHSVELLWHPSLSHAPTRRFDELIQAIGAGEQRLDILCVEGSAITAPRGTGMFDRHKDRAKMDIVRELAQAAEAVVAMGTCAAYGAVHVAELNPSDCAGLQFERAAPGGLLGAEMEARLAPPDAALALLNRFARGLHLHQRGAGTGHMLSYGVCYEPAAMARGERVTRMAGGFLDGESGQTQALDQGLIKEHVRHSWYLPYAGGRHPWEGESVPDYRPDSERYSWAKAPATATRWCRPGHRPSCCWAAMP